MSRRQQGGYVFSKPEARGDRTSRQRRGVVHCTGKNETAAAGLDIRCFKGGARYQQQHKTKG